MSGWMEVAGVSDGVAWGVLTEKVMLEDRPGAREQGEFQWTESLGEGCETGRYLAGGWSCGLR